MLNALISKLVGLFGKIIAIFAFGKLKEREGKNKQKIKQQKGVIDNVKRADDVEDRVNRDNDIDTPDWMYRD